MSRTGLDAETLARSLRARAGDGSIEWVCEPIQTSVLLDIADMLDDNAKLQNDADLLRAMLSQVQTEKRCYMADNAELQETLQRRSEQFEGMCEMWAKRGVENYKLRELVADMWRFTGTVCKKYPRLFDPAAQGGQTVQLNAIDAFEQRMCELGVEVE